MSTIAERLLAFCGPAALVCFFFAVLGLIVEAWELIERHGIFDRAKRRRTR
jgi:hypothetical protein